jgi:endonuclease G
MLHLFDPNVSLIDLGWRILDRQGQEVERELCVRVHVRQKPYGKAFDTFAALYPERVVDPERIGYRVDVPKANYRTHQWTRWPGQPVAPSNVRGRLSNPMRGGISISNALMSGFGTLGGKVIDRETGKELILSNWHVLVSTWYAWPGLAIYQPGQGDGGQSPYTVALLKNHAMDQMIDAAVAELTGARPLINDQLDIGPVTGAGEPVIGMRVTKSGRRTGVTTGIITGIEGRQAMNYGGIPRVIRHVVHITQAPEGGPVSDRGDSGSWWLEETTRRAVGLHFAGSNEPEYGLAIAMPQVLDALNVDIATAIEPAIVEPEGSQERELVRV